MKTISFAAEKFILDPDRAVFRPQGRQLIVADTHFGKDATARALGWPVPSGATRQDLDRLEQLARQYQARAIWILGDVFDSPAAGEPHTLDELHGFRIRTGFPISMVPGNHDRHARKIAETAGFQWSEEGSVDGGIEFAHSPLEGPCGRPRLCGHIHPGTTLYGPGRDRLTAPCFWLRGRQLILPAFGTLTGLARIRPAKGDLLWAAAGGKIVECRLNSRPPPRTSESRDLD